VTIEQERLQPGEQAGVAVEVGPPGLHHRDPRVGEGADGLAQEVGRRHEVGVEDRVELAARDRAPGVEGAGLPPGAGGAPQVDHIDAPGPPGRDLGGDDRGGVVGRVVEDLDLEAIARPVEASGGGDGPGRDRALVVERERNGDDRRGRQLARRGRRPTPARADHQRQAMEAVEREHGERGQVDRPHRAGRYRHGRPLVGQCWTANRSMVQATPTWIITPPQIDRVRIATVPSTSPARTAPRVSGSGLP
jgi:hypothetical protein